ncbi:SIMPL domain-containing protein [Winogradskyella sp. SM1960]|uniref:SIMPL domain-containing protein n=1 Tax=Winogradskyella sp. SM1960 TaxID=2865955 RepID=UPI001CD6ABC7|nr:SIMPL domain-containing protein [Winogradskyella sp. SM1960]
MKKIIFLMALVFSVPLIAQEHRNTITVVGETQAALGNSSYTILISLQPIFVYEGQTEVEVASLAEAKQNYIKQLKAIGIDFSRFKRNAYYEFMTSYSSNRASEYYYIKTSNKEEVRKITRLKSAGMSIANTDIDAHILSKEQLVDLSKKAIDNAEEKAEALAKKIDKTIGEIVTIVDQNTSEQYMQSYGTSTSQTHIVTVTFELK